MKHYKLKDKDSYNYSWVEFKISNDNKVMYLARGSVEWRTYEIGVSSDELAKWSPSYELVSNVNYKNKGARI